jgi:hypothetical protein
MTSTATDQAIAAKLAELHASAEQTREHLRELWRMAPSSQFTLSLSRLASIDGGLGSLAKMEYKRIEGADKR